MKKSIQLFTISMLTLFTVLMTGNGFAGNRPLGGELRGWSPRVQFVSFESNYCRKMIQGTGMGIRCQTRLGDLSDLEGRTYMIPSSNYSRGLERISFGINQCTETKTTISCQKNTGRIFSRR